MFHIDEEWISSSFGLAVQDIKVQFLDYRSCHFDFIIYVRIFYLGRTLLGRNLCSLCCEIFLGRQFYFKAEVNPGNWPFLVSFHSDAGLNVEAWLPHLFLNDVVFCFKLGLSNNDCAIIANWLGWDHLLEGLLGKSGALRGLQFCVSTGFDLGSMVRRDNRSVAGIVLQGFCQRKYQVLVLCNVKYLQNVVLVKNVSLDYKRFEVIPQRSAEVWVDETGGMHMRDSKWCDVQIRLGDALPFKKGSCKFDETCFWSAAIMVEIINQELRLLEDYCTEHTLLDNCGNLLVVGTLATIGILDMTSHYRRVVFLDCGGGFKRKCVYRFGHVFASSFSELRVQGAASISSSDLKLVMAVVWVRMCVGCYMLHGCAVVPAFCVSAGCIVLNALIMYGMLEMMHLCLAWKQVVVNRGDRPRKTYFMA